MSKRTVNAQPAQRTTLYVALATFFGLSLIAVVVWALSRPETSVAPVPTVAEAAVMPAALPGAALDFPRISIEELKPLVDAGKVMLLDVRSMEQFVQLHIAGAGQIPVARIEGEIPYLPKDKLIVTYCTCPNEESSGEAVLIMARGGIQAKALKGGLDAWTRLGYPTASGVQ